MLKILNGFDIVFLRYSRYNSQQPNFPFWVMNLNLQPFLIGDIYVCLSIARTLLFAHSVKGKPLASVKMKKKKEFILSRLSNSWVFHSIFVPVPSHLCAHSYGNGGQEMRGFSRSMCHSGLCAQAAAAEARGEIEFGSNSPVSLALGWTRLDRCKRRKLWPSVKPSILGNWGSWLLSQDLSRGQRELFHYL